MRPIQLKPKQLLLGLILFKIVIVVAILSSMGKGLYVGDVSLQAAEEVKSSTARADAANAPKEEMQIVAAEPIEEEGGGDSILDELLNIRQAAPEKIKREELGRYLELFEKKQRQLTQKAADMKRRQNLLVNLEKTVDDKLRRIEEERQFLLETLQDEKVVQDDRLEKLIKLYEKMEPKKAAPVFEQMDKDLVVALFNQIPQKQITRILEVMDPERSVQLTEYFGRVRSGREYELLKEVNASLREEFEKCKQ